MANGRTWLRAGVVLAGLWLAWHLLHVLVLVAVALLVSAALAPIVRWLNRRGAPHALSAAVTLLGLFGLLAGFGVYLAPLLTEQATQFGASLPSLADRWSQLEDQWRGWREQTPLLPRAREVTAWLQSQASVVFASAIGLTGRFVTFLVGLVSVLFMTFFFLMEGNRLRDQVLSLAPVEARERARGVLNEVARQVGHYMLGRLLVMAVVGVLVTIGLWLLGVPYAVLLGVVAGLLDIVPFIGPVLAAVPGVAVGLSLSPEKALWVAGMYWAVQSIEGYVLSPFIVGRTVGLHPVWVFLALLVGETFLGLVGAILSIPAAVAAQVLIRLVYRPYLASRHRKRLMSTALGGLPFPTDKPALIAFAERPDLTALPLPEPEVQRMRAAFHDLADHPYPTSDDAVRALEAAGAFDTPWQPAEG